MDRVPTGLTLARLVGDMRACEQTTGLSVLAHGRAVRDRHGALLEGLRAGRPPRGGWRLPPWAFDPLLLERQMPDPTVARYQVFHDCVIRTPGKPVHGHRPASA